MANFCEDAETASRTQSDRLEAVWSDDKISSSVFVGLLKMNFSQQQH